MEETRTTVRRFVGEKLARDRVMSFDDRTSLVASDILDSTAVLQLASFLQERFGITIRDDELVLQNVESIEAIAAFVQRKRHEGNA